MMSETYCITLATTVVFEVIVATASCLDSGVRKMERQSADSNACWQRAERM